METKKTILILATFFIVQIGFGQNKNVCPIVKFDTDWSEEICLNYKSQNQLYSFVDNQEAIGYVQKLMDLAGLPMNFIVSECSGIQNAFAYNYDGIQYIFYGNEFLESLNSNSNDIGSITVLAHEIGHHLAGHTSANSYISQYCKNAPCNDQSQDCLDALEISRKRELQADRFAGFIMYKFGSSLSQTQEAFRRLLNNQDYEDLCSTHPTLSKRLNAIKEGYDKAKQQEEAVLKRQEKREEGEEVEEPTEKENLEDIKGNKIEFELPNIKEIEKNKLLAKLDKTIIYSIHPYFKLNSNLAIGGSKITGENYKVWEKIDNRKEYFEKFNVRLELSYDKSVKVELKMAYHIQNGIISILERDTEKTLYEAPFDSEIIDFNELKVIFMKKYQMLVENELEKK